MIDGDDLELFERSLRHATESGTGAALDAALADLGWTDALDLDPRAAVSLLFSLQGRANATSSALGHVVLGSLGLEGTPVLPALTRWDPPGTVEDGRLTVDGLGLAGFGDAEQAVVVSRDGDKDVALTVPTASLSLRAVDGVDPELGLVAVTGTVDAAGSGTPVEGWDTAVDRARVALGYELVGASRRMLELAREHALEREQFGQVIAQFQAIRHKLAETLVAIETAEAVLDVAWLDPTPATASMAKALSGRAARVAAKHCQQVLAGIGFTTEHPLHLHIRRVLVLDQLLGSAKTLTAELGTQLLASRQLPPLLPL